MLDPLMMIILLAACLYLKTIDRHIWDQWVVHSLELMSCMQSFPLSSGQFIGKPCLDYHLHGLPNMFVTHPYLPARVTPTGGVEC